MAVIVDSQEPPKKFKFRHGRTYLVEKSWDASAGGGGPEPHYTFFDKKLGITRAAIIIYSANAKDMAETYCINSNKACAKCPERTRLRMHYKVLERSVPSEYRFESDS